MKYRQTLTGLGTRLAGTPVARDVGALDTAARAIALLAAFTAAFGAPAPATWVRHLPTLRSALSGKWDSAMAEPRPDHGPGRAEDHRAHEVAWTRGQVGELFRVEAQLGMGDLAAAVCAARAQSIWTAERARFWSAE